MWHPDGTANQYDIGTGQSSEKMIKLDLPLTSYTRMNFDRFNS